MILQIWIFIIGIGTCLFAEFEPLNGFHFSDQALKAFGKISDQSEIVTFSKFESLDGYGKFALIPTFLKPNRSYLWFIVDERDLSYQHICPFETDANGEIVDENQLSPFTARFYKGQRCVSSLYDLNDKSYTLDWITPIPFEYFFTTGAKVQVSMKFPADIYHFEFLGWNPFEQARILFNREESVVMDSNGCGFIDIWNCQNKKMYIHSLREEIEIDLFSKTDEYFDVHIFLKKKIARKI